VKTMAASEAGRSARRNDGYEIHSALHLHQPRSAPVDNACRTGPLPVELYTKAKRRLAATRYLPAGALSPPVMNKSDTKSVTKDEIKVERPRLHKVILINDDYTPREFVVTVLKAEFRITEDQAMRVMITAHRRGACVVAVYTKDVAESKATNATDAGRSKGYPLLFTTEPEE
jgi:ATP-dependent Clp protease adaptor protein ClpS